MRTPLKTLCCFCCGLVLLLGACEGEVGFPDPTVEGLAGDPDDPLTADDEEPPLEGLAGESRQAASACTGSKPFSWSYCTSSCPCGAGQGDCDRNSHCQAGLVCKANVGKKYGVSSTVDVCEAPDSNPGGSPGGSPGTTPGGCSNSAHDECAPGATQSCTYLGKHGTKHCIPQRNGARWGSCFLPPLTGAGGSASGVDPCASSNECLLGARRACTSLGKQGHKQCLKQSYGTRWGSGCIVDGGGNNGGGNGAWGGCSGTASDACVPGSARSCSYLGQGGVQHCIPQRYGARWGSCFLPPLSGAGGSASSVDPCASFNECLPGARRKCTRLGKTGYADCLKQSYGTRFSTSCITASY